jgi:hypothetical protein
VHDVARPGEVFGSTQLPPAHSTSVELVVDQEDIERTMGIVQGTIDAARGDDVYHLGAIGVRLVPQTTALLGMNKNPMNAFIEVAGIRNGDAPVMHDRIWDALEREGVTYSCHWGQEHNFTPERVRAYYGSAMSDWVGARRFLIPETNLQRVFASDILADAGLE